MPTAKWTLYRDQLGEFTGKASTRLDQGVDSLTRDEAVEMIIDLYETVTNAFNIETSAEALDLLLKIALETGDEDVRSHAIQDIGDLCIGTDVDMRAVEALVTIGTDEAADTLYSVVQNRAFYGRPEKVIDALARMQNVNASAYIGEIGMKLPEQEDYCLSVLKNQLEDAAPLKGAIAGLRKICGPFNTAEMLADMLRSGEWEEALSPADQAVVDEFINETAQALTDPALIVRGLKSRNAQENMADKSALARIFDETGRINKNVQAQGGVTALFNANLAEAQKMVNRQHRSWTSSAPKRRP